MRSAPNTAIKSFAIGLVAQMSIRATHAGELDVIRLGYNPEAFTGGADFGRWMVLRWGESPLSLTSSVTFARLASLSQRKQSHPRHTPHAKSRCVQPDWELLPLYSPFGNWWWRISPSLAADVALSAYAENTQVIDTQGTCELYKSQVMSGSNPIPDQFVGYVL